jgi:HEAT repeat protein
MSETPAASPEPEKPAPQSVAVPLVFWLVIACLLGLAVGMWRPWDGAGQRHTPSSPEILVQELRDTERGPTAYLQLISRGEEAGPALLGAAQDPAFPERKRVVELLGRVRYAPATEFLVGLKDPGLAAERLTALGNIGGEKALGALREGLQSQNEELRFVALRELSDWNDPVERALRDEVIPFLKDEHFGQREFAAKFCGRQRDAQAVTPLVALLEDERGDVRQAAAWALTQIGTEEAIEAVQAAYAKGAIPEAP